jgi:Na+/proline symporter
MQHVPTGLKGVLLAGVFAAAISSLDSILAALSQTTLAATWLQWRRRALGLGEDEQLPEDDERRSVRYSRVLVLVFGVLLCVLAVGVRELHESYPSILDLSLAMTSYTQGALLAGVLLALTGERDGSGFGWAAAVSVLAVFSVAWHGEGARRVSAVAAFAILALWLCLGPRAGWTVRRLSVLAFSLVLCLALSREIYAAGAEEAAERTLAYPWYVPLGSSVAFALAWVLGRPLQAAASEV